MGTGCKHGYWLLVDQDSQYPCSRLIIKECERTIILCTLGGVTFPFFCGGGGVEFCRFINLSSMVADETLSWST